MTSATGRLCRSRPPPSPTTRKRERKKKKLVKKVSLGDASRVPRLVSFSRRFLSRRRRGGGGRSTPRRRRGHLSPPPAPGVPSVGSAARASTCRNPSERAKPTPCAAVAVRCPAAQRRQHSRRRAARAGDVRSKRWSLHGFRGEFHVQFLRDDGGKFRTTREIFYLKGREVFCGLGFLSSCCDACADLTEF